MGRILDQDGNVIELDVLGEEIATPQLTGVRQVWQRTVSGGLTPERLITLLEGSINNANPSDYLTLAEDLEERDGHYFSVLSTRKLAVESIEPIVEAASDDAMDQKIADATREMLALECVEDARPHLLDGLGKSYAVGETVWDRSGKVWMPERIEERDPRWFRWDELTRRELRLLDQADPINGLALAPFKFIVHRPRLKSGLPIRNGLARIVAFLNLCSMYCLKDWMAVLEVLGQPVRVGKYGPSATPRDIAMLRRAVANIGTDAACVIPESMAIEFTQAANISGASGMFKELSTYLDDQKSKIVLGQTNTTDAKSGGMGSGQAEVHDRVRGDIRDADGKQLARTLKRDLVRPFVTLNFGAQYAVPQITIKLPKPENIEQLTKALQVFVPMGMRVEQSIVRDKLGLPDPPADAKPEDLLGTPPALAALPAPNDAQIRATNRRQVPADVSSRDEIDRLVDLAADGWEEQLSPIVLAVEQLAAEAGSAEEFMRRLPLLATEASAPELVQSLALRFFQARGLGNATDDLAAR